MFRSGIDGVKFGGFASLRVQSAFFYPPSFEKRGKKVIFAGKRELDTS